MSTAPRPDLIRSPLHLFFGFHPCHRKFGSETPCFEHRLYKFSGIVKVVVDPPVTMDQTAYTREVQQTTGGAAKSVDREKHYWAMIEHP